MPIDDAVTSWVQRLLNGPWADVRRLSFFPPPFALLSSFLPVTALATGRVAVEGKSPRFALAHALGPEDVNTMRVQLSAWQRDTLAIDCLRTPRCRP